MDPGDVAPKGRARHRTPPLPATLSIPAASTTQAVEPQAVPAARRRNYAENYAPVAAGAQGAGEPVVLGGRRFLPICKTPNAYEVLPDGTATIGLRRGLVARIDSADLPVVARFRWCAVKLGKGTYVVAPVRDVHTGKQTSLYLHRLLTLAPKGRDVDHENHDPLDNRRKNIRVCTRSQNNQNMRTEVRTSRFKGVSRKGSRWRAAIGHAGSQRFLGTYSTETEAAQAYDTAARRIFGEFAHLNLPARVAMTLLVSLLMALCPRAQDTCAYPPSPPHPAGVSDWMFSCYTGLDCDSTAGTTGSFAQLRLSLAAPASINTQPSWMFTSHGAPVAVLPAGSGVWVHFNTYTISPGQMYSYPPACKFHTASGFPPNFTTYDIPYVWPAASCCGWSLTIPWGFTVPNDPSVVGTHVWCQASWFENGVGSRLVMSQAIKVVFQP